jgi:hypothetical protein
MLPTACYDVNAIFDPVPKWFVALHDDHLILTQTLDHDAIA